MQKMRWLGWLGVTLAYRQCHHSIGCIRLPIRLYQKLYVYLVPFVRYSLRHVHRRSIQLPLLRLTPPAEGFSCDDLLKILHGDQRMAGIHSGEEILPKGSTPWVGCTNVTDRRQTDDRRIIGDSNDPNVTQSRQGNKIISRLFHASSTSVCNNFILTHGNLPEIISKLFHRLIAAAHEYFPTCPLSLK